MSEKGFGLVCGYSKASHRSVLLTAADGKAPIAAVEEEDDVPGEQFSYVESKCLCSLLHYSESKTIPTFLEKNLFASHYRFFAVLFGNPALHLSFIAAGFFSSFFLLAKKKRKKSWWVCFSFWLIKRGHVKGTHQLLLTMVQCWVLFESHVLCL